MTAAGMATLGGMKIGTDGMQRDIALSSERVPRRMLKKLSGFDISVHYVVKNNTYAY